MTVAITRTDLDAKGLRAAAAHSKDTAASRRMLALALVLQHRFGRSAKLHALFGDDNRPVNEDGVRYPGVDENFIRQARIIEANLFVRRPFPGAARRAPTSPSGRSG